MFHHHIPQHSGYSLLGVERAISYIQKILSEVSSATRMDVEGHLDGKKIQELEEKLEQGVDALKARLDKINLKKKSKKKSAYFTPQLVKMAEKSMGVQGIYVTVPLFISRIARVCINGMVSGGKDIEDLFHRQIKKYKLNEREQAETMQLLADMGYSLRSDRGFLIDDEEDKDNKNYENGYDFSSQYYQ